MNELICSRCGRISEEVEAFRLAILLNLTIRKDYEKLEKLKLLFRGVPKRWGKNIYADYLLR